MTLQFVNTSITFLVKILIICLLISPSYALPSSRYVVSSIQVKGNRITNERVILRELPFALGDTINHEDIPRITQQVKENLDNTQLFNFVHLNVDTNDHTLSWTIEVEERWYIWPVPILEYADRNLSSFLREGDYSRVNFGGFLTIENFRGMRDQLMVRLVLGYRKQAAIRYTTYSLDRHKRHGIRLWVSYVTNHEVPFISFNNRQVFYKSFDGKIRTTLVTEAEYFYRPGHNWRHQLTLGHEMVQVSDTIAKLNPNYFGNGSNLFNVTKIRYRAHLEKRNLTIFPLSGYYVRGEVSRFGIFPDENVSFWNTTIAAGYFTPTFPKLFAGSDAMIRLSTTENLPYYLNDAIGYKNFIRGYEYYVTNGANFFINKTSLKYQLLSPRVIMLPFINEGRFKKAHLAIYWGVFADTGMVSVDSNSLTGTLEGKLIYGYGSGLYFVAYYDIVFRVEYSMNMFGERGVFIHFGTPFLSN